MKNLPRRCVIFAGGEISDSMKDRLCPNDYIIAADAGVLAVRRFGLQPDLCVGDWDSAPRPETAAECITLPPEKDDTDTYHAARLAVERGFGRVLLLGGMGGRLDHTFANVSTLLYLRKHNVAPVMEDDRSRVTVLHNEAAEFEKRPGFYLSVFPISGDARGVSICGAKYPLVNATLTEDYPIGVSNEIVKETAKIEVTDGYLMVLYAR